MIAHRAQDPGMSAALTDAIGPRDDALAACPVPIRERIQARLDELGESPAWLADRMGAARSTVTRILRGERNPTPETLAEMAPVLGVSVAQLVANTDAAERVKEAGEMISRRDYEAAVHDVIEYHRQANDLTSRLHDAEQLLQQEQERARERTENLAACERLCSKLTDERDRARRDALRHERDARRYRDALEKAVADVAHLQTQVRELGAAVDAGRVTTRIAAILAGVAAVVSVATYLNNESASDAGDERKAPEGQP
jgi:transcriptional regulator with XRE-family HTH domain